MKLGTFRTQVVRSHCCVQTLPIGFKRIVPAESGLMRHSLPEKELILHEQTKKE